MKPAVQSTKIEIYWKTHLDRQLP